MILIWILTLLGVIAHLPLTVRNFAWMWNAEHYQYFPIAIGAAALLLYTKRNEFREIRFAQERAERAASNAGFGTVSYSARNIITSIALVLNLVVISFATLLLYALAGWLSLIFFFAILIYHSYGWEGLKLAIPSIIVLLIIRPLPASLEQMLTINMQQLASLISSRLLDGFGLYHYRNGVVLVLVDQSFMAEEACSGIRSLFSSITAIVFWGLLNKFHWLRHILNIVQTCIWVVVYNAIRIFAVVFVEAKTDYSIATGFPHEAAGLISFFLIFATVLSTDSFFAAFTTVGFEGDDEIEPINSNLLGKERIWSALNWHASQISGIAFIVAFTLLATASVRLEFMRFRGSLFDSFAGESVLGTPTSEDIPLILGEWKQDNFEHVHRPDNHQMGSDSYMWKLSNDNRKLIVSIDGTFDDYHELALCYDIIGWDVKPTYFYDASIKTEEMTSEKLSEFTQLALTKQTGETGIVLFSALDRNGMIVPSPPPIGKNLFENLKVRLTASLRQLAGVPLTSQQRSTSFSPPVSTIQMVYMPSQEVSESDIEELRSLFLTVRETLRKSPRFNKAN